MANKKYTEFDPSPATPERIFLHADPVTGALNRASVQQFNPSLQYVYADTSQPFNEFGGTFRMFERTIPPNTIVNPGDCLKMRFHYSNGLYDPDSFFQFRAFDVGFDVTGLGFYTAIILEVTAWLDIYGGLFVAWTEQRSNVLTEPSFSYISGFDPTISYNSYLEYTSADAAGFGGFIRQDFLFTLPQ